MYNIDGQINFKAKIFNLCDYSDANVLIKNTITIIRQAAGAPDRNEEEIITVLRLTTVSVK